VTTFAEQIEEIVAMQKAPPGRFRVLVVDSFSNPPFGEPFVIADCDDKDTATKLAMAHGSNFQPTYVYDDQGGYLFGAGQR
jgi:hypothetical protein